MSERPRKKLTNADRLKALESVDELIQMYSGARAMWANKAIEAPLHADKILALNQIDTHDEIIRRLGDVRVVLENSIFLARKLGQLLSGPATTRGEPRPPVRG